MPPSLHLLTNPHLLHGGVRHELPNNVPGFLLAWLALHGEWASRETLCAVFWPERRDALALHNLRANLHRLKQLMTAWGAGAQLQTERRRVRLQLACDVAQFRAACGAGQWNEALRLYQTPLLAGLSLAGMPAVDEWLHTQRGGLEAAWREAALRQAQALETLGEHGQAARLLLQQLEQDTLAEDLLQALLRVALAAGCREAALATHERFARRLGSELGLAPMPGTVALAAALRASVADTPPAAAHPLRWLGAEKPLPQRSLPARLATPPLVGRASALAAAQTACSQPGARLVLVCGEPGSGKTRLLEAALADAAWLPCREGLRAAPLHPVIDYIEDTLEALRGLPVFAEHRPLIARLVPAAGDGLRSAPAQAGVTEDALLGALQAVLGALQRPLVVDDLQWADNATLRLVQALCLHGDHPVAATMRSHTAAPELQALLDRLQAEGRLQRIELEPLGEPALRELVADLSGQPGGAPVFARWLHERSAGNAFFALETLRGLFAAGQLQADSDGWHSALDRISSSYAELAVPPRVAEMVRRRVEGMADGTRRVLRICAVAGDARLLEPLAQVAGLSPMALAEALGEAQAAGILKEREFAHDLVREALYSELPEAVRATTHSLLLSHAGERLAPHARAAHAWQAGEPALAVAATLQAARMDAVRGLHSAACAALCEALKRVEAPELRAPLFVELAGVALQQGRLDAANAHAQQAMDELPGPRERALALTVQGEVAIQQGRIDAVPPLAQAAQEALPELPEALMLQTKFSHATGDYAAAEHAMRRRVSQLRQERPEPELVAVLTSLGAAIDFQGRYAEASPFHREALALARKLRAPYAEVEVVVNMLWSLPEMGLHAEAVALGERTLALGEYDATPTLLNNLAWLHLEQGRLHDAARLYRELSHTADPTLRCFAGAKLLQISASQGHDDAAAAAATELLEAMARTDHAQAHATAVLALLDHGPAALAMQAVSRLPAGPLDTSLKARLRVAVARHGIEMPPSLT